MEFRQQYKSSSIQATVLIKDPRQKYIRSIMEYMNCTLVLTAPSFKSIETIALLAICQLKLRLQVLHEVDFKQMRIENNQYLEKIEERNQELLKLKHSSGNTLQVRNRHLPFIRPLTGHYHLSTFNQAFIRLDYIIHNSIEIPPSLILGFVLTIHIKAS